MRLDSILACSLFVVLSAASIGCSGSAPSTIALAHTFDSPEALAQAVLDRIAQQDLAALRTLALTEEEFREHVWPELPASRPERHLPFEYVWGQLKQRSSLSLQQTFSRYRGQRFDLLAISFEGETTRYPTFMVRSDSALRVKNEQGVESTIRLFGSVMVKDARFKLFSFVVDQ